MLAGLAFGGRCWRQSVSEAVPGLAGSATISADLAGPSVTAHGAVLAPEPVPERPSPQAAVPGLGGRVEAVGRVTRGTAGSLRESTPPATTQHMIVRDAAHPVPPLSWQWPDGGRGQAYGVTGSPQMPAGP
jgi:hypothetical protein